MGRIGGRGEVRVFRDSGCYTEARRRRGSGRCDRVRRGAATSKRQPAANIQADRMEAGQQTEGIKRAREETEQVRKATLCIMYLSISPLAPAIKGLRVCVRECRGWDSEVTVLRYRLINPHLWGQLPLPLAPTVVAPLQVQVAGVVVVGSLDFAPFGSANPLSSRCLLSLSPLLPRPSPLLSSPFTH